MTSCWFSVICLILTFQHITASEVHSRVRRATVGELTTDCGATAGCYLNPPGCSGTACDYAASYTVNGANIDFMIAAKIDASFSGDFYLAMGISEDQQMADTSVVDCIYQSGSSSVVIQASWNPGYSNDVLTDATLGLSSPSGSFADGYLVCSFTREMAPTATGSDVGKVYDISAGNSYYILMAQGTASGTTKEYHGTNRVFSSESVDFTVVVDVGGEAAEGIGPLVKLHAICMTLAWILLATFGIKNARYFKGQWPDKRPFDKDLWFWFHRTSMSLVVILTIVGFIAIFVDVGGLSNDVLTSPTLLLRGHPIIGIIVPILAIINPIMAFFRPHPGTSKRPIFNWFHRFVGSVGLILGVLNVFIGLQLPHAEALKYPWATWMLVGWVIFHFLIEVTLMCFLRRPAMKGDGAMEMKGPGESSGLSGSDGGSCASFGTIILVIYVLVTLIVTLIIVIPIAVEVENLPGGA